MSNPIKYSTGSETLALKKGNFYIGTGDVGKGPTSTTGYYNGISPPSGGYTIYLNKESGGPSIYTASNDAQLISLTNSIAGTSYTTANECLTYFAGQTDKMVLNRNYEGIITDGLVFNLDAGFTPSYPKNGTTWYDISGSNNGTLTNGPTFSGGSIVFDGVDDYVQFNTTITLNYNKTFIFWLNYNGETGSVYHLLNKDTQGGDTQNYRNRVFIDENGLYVYSSLNSTTVNFTFSENIKNKNKQIGFTTDSNSMYLIEDGTITQQTSVSFPDGDRVYQTIGAQSALSGVLYYKGNVSSLNYYNRALSADEVLQNYNAQKGRFGL